MILFSSALESDAATTSMNLTYTQNRIDTSKFNTMIPSNLDGGSDVGSGDISEIYMGYHIAKSYQICVPKESDYAYKITVSTSNISMSSSGLIWCRPYIGTYEQVFSGQGYLGREVANNFSATTNFYIVTNGSTSPLTFNLLFKCCYSSTPSSVSITSGTATVTYTAITKSQYETDVMAELQEQTETQKDILEEDKAQTEQLVEQTKQIKEQTETQKGLLNKITEFFGSFFQNLIDSVIGLFVPSKEELSEIFSRFDEFFSSKFGFLYYSFEVLGDFLTVFGKPIPEEPKLTFPGFSIMGHEVWAPYVFYIGRDSLIREIFTYVRMGTSSIIVFAFINYCSKKFKGVVNK